MKVDSYIMDNEIASFVDDILCKTYKCESQCDRYESGSEYLITFVNGTYKFEMFYSKKTEKHVLTCRKQGIDRFELIVHSDDDIFDVIKNVIDELYKN